MDIVQAPMLLFDVISKTYIACFATFEMLTFPFRNTTTKLIALSQIHTVKIYVSENIKQINTELIVFQSLQLIDSASLSAGRSWQSRS